MKSPSFWWKSPPTPLARLLLPLGWLYGQVATWHGAWREAHKVNFSVSIINVGNLTVGGAGKTPLVQWVATHLAAMGHQVAIVSRGYRGAYTYQPLQVRPDLHTAEEVGDEPLLLAQAFPHQAVSVWVGRNRPTAVRRAIQAGATVVVLDDAYQRRDVGRNFNILVANAATLPFGNGRCLPAGPLREPLRALSRADAVVLMNSTYPAQPVPELQNLQTPILHLATVPSAASMEPLQNHRLLAFCGLAHPEKFLSTLTHAGLNVVATHFYPDHHSYTSTDLKALQNDAQRHQAVRVTTTKDATKLPPNFAYVLDITLSGTDATALLSLLREKAPLPHAAGD